MAATAADLLRQWDAFCDLWLSADKEARKVFKRQRRRLPDNDDSST